MKPFSLSPVCLGVQGAGASLFQGRSARRHSEWLREGVGEPSAWEEKSSFPHAVSDASFLPSPPHPQGLEPR